MDIIISDIINELLEIIDSLAYDLAGFMYPKHYDLTADKESILNEYGIDKILQKIDKIK